MDCRTLSKKYTAELLIKPREAPVRLDVRVRFELDDVPQSCLQLRRVRDPKQGRAVRQIDVKPQLADETCSDGAQLLR